MLCPGCHRQLSKAASVCGHCGLPRDDAASPLELVLPDGTRVPVVNEMTLGRAPGSTLVLADPTVSRTHARIAPADNGGLPVLEDVGSSAGTYMDGAKLEGPAQLRDGMRISLGTFQIGVERRRDAAEAGRTIVVRPGASMLVSAVGGSESATGAATQYGFRPRVRSGYALKRLEASEGSKRYVLRDLRTDKFLRMSERDASIFERLDGQTSLVELISFAEQEFGAAGSARVARLLADLGERGFLAGVDTDSDMDAVDAPKSRFRRWMGPHVKEFRGIAPFFERIYERGGWVLFLRPVLIALAVIIVAGIGCFTYLILGRYGTPFVVAKKIGLGGLIFLLGRFAFAAVHEVAHGLTMASYGRRVDRAGIKAIFILPYVFVDTTEAWFEPRKHRIAVSAAGPVSDFTIGGTFAILSTVVDGTLRDVFFNLTFSAYIGGMFNLNPFLDRDGYHILVDVLREPGLKKRAKAQFERRMSGDKRETDNKALARFSIAAAVWSIVGALFAIGMSLRYEKIMVAFAPKPVVYVVMATIWLFLFLPFFFTVGKPMLQGRRKR